MALGTVTIALGRRGIGRLGLASVAAILLGAIVAAVPYRGAAGESYSPLNHFISELGEVAISSAAWSYNLGILLGGLGLTAFLLFVSRAMTGRLRTIFTLFSCAAGAGGSLCGLYPMDCHAIHRLVSSVFFVGAWLLAGTFTLWLARARAPLFPRWLLVPGSAAVAIFAAFIAVYATYHPADPNAPILARAGIWTVPLLEWASLLSLLVWLTCLSLALLRRTTTEPTD